MVLLLKIMRGVVGGTASVPELRNFIFITLFLSFHDDLLTFVVLMCLINTEGKGRLI